ncbi:DUF3265 domain-containing protein, partial [Vibrio parahaemolyticus]|nr:DUF3265 domain-containing protein [Vibrio parahaemolyticus]
LVLVVKVLYGDIGIACLTP